MEQFRKLGISEEILKAIHEHKFEKPSEVQEKAIPLILQGKDVIGGSATGSGKTLAFGAALIQNAEKGKGIQGLVMTPTRELAEQITQALERFSKYKPLKIVSIYGGVSINPQIADIRTADIVVGTPGRILDHLARQTIEFYDIKTLVLDEADRMFDMGFIDDVKKIISQIPRKRQTLLFSATISPEVAHLADKFMINPVEVAAEAQVDPKKLSQVYYDIDDSQKFSLLVHLIQHEHAGLIMVFCNTRRNTDFVAKNLHFLGIDASAIHGGFSQEKRSRTMEQFHTRSVHVLVCTDVAARGLDIKGVSHVYNYDIPKDSKEYVHRIGRTARAGKEGKAVNIVASRDYENFNRVLRDNDLNIVKEQTPDIQRVRIRWMPERREGGFGGSGGFRGREGSRDGYRSGGTSRGYHGHTNSRGPSRGSSYSRPRHSSFGRR